MSLIHMSPHERHDRETRRARSRDLAAPPSEIPAAVPRPRDQLVVPREQGPAASLASYQLDVLRDKNRELPPPARAVRDAQENERLAVRTHQLTLALMRQGNAADTRARDGRGAGRGFPGRPGAHRAVRAGGGPGRCRVAAVDRRRRRAAGAVPRCAGDGRTDLRPPASGQERAALRHARRRSADQRAVADAGRRPARRSAATTRTVSSPAWARCSCA